MKTRTPQSRLLNSSSIRGYAHQRPLWLTQLYQLLLTLAALAALTWLANNPKPGEPSWMSGEAELEASR